MTGPAGETQTVVVERDFAHPPERLWRALTQPHLIAEWLMPNDFVGRVGHRFTLNGEWGGALDCEVLALAPYQSLSYSWNHVHADPAFDLPSIVTFTLTPTDVGTRLRMEQTGFRPEQRQASGGAKFGWQRNLAKLDDVLATLDPRA